MFPTISVFFPSYLIFSTKHGEAPVIFSFCLIGLLNRHCMSLTGFIFRTFKSIVKDLSCLSVEFLILMVECIGSNESQSQKSQKDINKKLSL